MSNIDKISKEALREVAEDAQKAHKWEGLENGLKADGYVSTTVRFIQRASPQTVLALLDELEAAEKRIADQSGIIESARKFISEYAGLGDVGAAEFVKIIDRAAAVGKGE